MMTDKNKLKTAQEWVDKLANGINPLTLEPVKEDDIVNNVHISRCLFYVCDLLSKIEINDTTPNKKSPFWMAAIDAEQINVLTPNGIAQFARIINEHIPEDMKPLSAGLVIKWLRNEGYLYEEHLDDKHKTNLPTEKGNKIGITVQYQKNIDGQEYRRVIYDIQAQRFMLKNIESIALTR